MQGCTGAEAGAGAGAGVSARVFPVVVAAAEPPRIGSWEGRAVLNLPMIDSKSNFSVRVW
jgi:hypothetical protein